jgi:uncharacterized membrane protein
MILYVLFIYCSNLKAPKRTFFVVFAISHLQFSETYTIELLKVKQCVELFQQHYGQMVRPAELATLKALIELAGQHTLTVELLAKIACVH